MYRDTDISLSFFYGDYKSHENINIKRYKKFNLYKMKILVFSFINKFFMFTDKECKGSMGN